LTNTGLVDVTEDHSLLDVNLNEIKPVDIFENQELFHKYPVINWVDLTEIPVNIIRTFNNLLLNNSNVIKTQFKILASYYYLLGIYNKKTVSISIEDTNVIVLQFNNNNNKVNVNVTLLYENYSGYVYDIETEDGTFGAGIGELVIKNTDSCYVIFPESVDADGKLTNLFKTAEHAAKEISKTFKKPIELEFEKFMYPLILVAKKRYMYIEWTKPEHHNEEIEAKGVELVRRDNCPYVKETLDAILKEIFFENNLKKGLKQAELHVDNLLTGKVQINKLILSKNLKDSYKNYEKIPTSDGNYKWIHTKQITERDQFTGKMVKTSQFEKIEEMPTMAHVALVEKMRLRDPNSAPKPGDRVPFVYIDIGDPKALSWKKTEDPQYVIENNIPIDYLYYLEHQLKSPIETIFNIIIGIEKCKEIFNRNSFIEAKKKEKQNISDAKRKAEGNSDIRNFFKVKIDI